jgi:hypothetical protein
MASGDASMPAIEKLPDPRSVPAAQESTHLDELLDEALEETFPASDPIALHVEDRTTRVSAERDREPLSDS